VGHNRCNYQFKVGEGDLNIIQSEDSPQKVHEILVSKWRIGLFRFAQVFAVSPADLALLRNDYPFSTKELSVIKHNLKAMQHDLIYRGRLILGITNKLWESPRISMSDEDLIKHMRLERFFKEYIHNHEEATRYASKMSLQGKRGGSINHKSIIAVGWGNLISGKSRRMDWQMLGDLYYWFWGKVSDYSFYEKLKPSDGIEEYLRHQYIRYRWTRGEVLKKADLNMRAVLRLVSALFSHQFWGGHKEYIKKTLSLSESELPKFFMNFVINYYLAGLEGLTIFSRDQAIADPGYKFLDVRLQKTVVSKSVILFSKWMFPRGIGDLKNPELPYRSSEIREYLSYAASLFVEHRISLKRPTPLIIFPDRSFFSTSF